MIDLADHELDTAARIASAGSAGVYLGDGLACSTAIRLELAGLATLTRGADQRALPTKEAHWLKNRTNWA